MRPRNACRAIIAPGKVQCGPKEGAPVVPLSNNVLGTDMLLKPSRKERSSFPGVVAYTGNVKGSKELYTDETEAQTK